MKKRINELMEMAKNSKVTKSMTESRYALKIEDNAKYLYNGKRLKGSTPQVKRIITHYDDSLVKVKYVIEGMPMFSKEEIIKANLTPIAENEIPKYFEITDTEIVYIYGQDGNSKQEIIEYKHEETTFHKRKRILKEMGINK